MLTHNQTTKTARLPQHLAILKLPKSLMVLKNHHFGSFMNRLDRSDVGLLELLELL